MKRRMLLTAGFVILGFVLNASSILCSACRAAPTIFFSDLTSGPKIGGKDNKGAFVTIWGKRFGDSQGTSKVIIGGGDADNYPQWYDSLVCFQLGSNAATGDIKIIVGSDTSNGVPFTVRDGNIFFVDSAATAEGSGTYGDPWSSPHSFYITGDTGDVCYFRKGTYSGQYGYTGWTANFCLKATEITGTRSRPVAFVGYPGERACFSAPGPDPPRVNFKRYSDDNTSAWITISKFYLKAYSPCITNNKPGDGWRVVGNYCDGLNRTVEAQSGIIAIGCDDARVLGNVVTGGRTGSKMDHAIYAKGCPDTIEIAWNYVFDNNFNRGPLIMINYEGFRCDEGEYNYLSSVHDNEIHATNWDGCRCIGVYDLSSDGTDQTALAKVYNNIIFDGGRSASSEALYQADGRAWFYNNTISGCRAYALNVYNNSDTTRFENNIILMNNDASGYVEGTIGNFKSDRNCYYGLGAYIDGDDQHPINADPKFANSTNVHLQGNSPCRDSANTLGSEFERDKDGYIRPTGSAWDLGVYEYTGPDSVPPVISNVVCSDTTDSSATIEWETDEYSTSQVIYWMFPDSIKETPLNAVLDTTHCDTLYSLRSSTKYYYRVKSRDASGNLAVSDPDSLITRPGQPGQPRWW